MDEVHDEATSRDPGVAWGLEKRGCFVRASRQALHTPTRYEATVISYILSMTFGACRLVFVSRPGQRNSSSSVPRGVVCGVISMR